jgi:hypothetical protein
LPVYGKWGPVYILLQGGSAYTKVSHKETENDAIRCIHATSRSNGLMKMKCK